MSTAGMSVRESPASFVGSIYRVLYRSFAYFGLFSVFGSLLYGFRYDASAPAGNIWFNLGLYAAFIAPHLIMTRSWFKRAVWGQAHSAPRERRFYITITVITWLAMCWLQRPVPGFSLALPGTVHFAGSVIFLFCAYLFFEGVPTNAIDGLLGVPGSVSAYSHGPETPLFTDGPYAKVRHPMYRAAILAGICGLVIHPHLGQLIFTLLIGATFVAFIPVEEAQMIAARGDDYLRYKQRTPYRLFAGIW
jgi:protein-S-isoprenylcysteine O-methyltransferase Ste14